MTMNLKELREQAEKKPLDLRASPSQIHALLDLIDELAKALHSASAAVEILDALSIGSSKEVDRIVAQSSATLIRYREAGGQK